MITTEHKAVDIGAPSLDHVLLVTQHAQPTLAFLTEVVGLHVGPRPPFRFAGWWLYAGDRAVVHIALREVGTAQELSRQVGVRTSGGGGGVVDHIAFRMVNAAAVRQRLDDSAWPYHEACVPETGECQFFVSIPEGPVVELVASN
ncbi:extradiol dioxygenase [Variovorax sp. ZS18.2.2]|uniref:extradiol dioxygenase n=1 Tax=Variovorax sp. ZS18.2.2 TaxID=2971255 RepID=UPI0021507C8A|nr:extradiol dioxygenase [Variovorax sp. ZS18.2.2]MCR6479815.1 extradiol dioxygenase [Variovorax sp. ZS18.2.2]